MPRFGIVNTARLNLREGPGTSHRIVDVLARGTVLEIVRDAGFDWMQVRVDGTGQEGYVSKIFLRLSDTRPTEGGTTDGGETLPEPGSEPVPVGKRGQVTSRALNVRAGPGVQHNVLFVVSQGALLDVLEQHGNWYKVRVGSREGFVASQFVNLDPSPALIGYLIEEPELFELPLAPERIIPPQVAGTAEAIVARTWNNYGGLIQTLADLLNIPTNTIVAVLAAESGGEAFGPNGRMIIRFEVHIFYRYWGILNAALFDQHFRFDRTSAARAWRGHQWRPRADAPWEDFHEDQQREWVVFSFARRLGEESALLSTSMGAPQIMGFNYKRLGYESVEQMFEKFSRSAHAQLLGVFDFVKGPGGTSTALQALQRRDYLTFASVYNGTANAHTYRALIRSYVTVFDRLIRSAVVPDET